jgi:hypothetical protein
MVLEAVLAEVTDREAVVEERVVRLRSAWPPCAAAMIRAAR